MPEDQIAPEEPNSFADLPIQPTGSGVQDLEIAYEQMRLAQGDPTTSSLSLDGSDGTALSESDIEIPTEDDEAARISAAHPS